MNKLTGAIMLLAAAVAGNGVFVFLSAHPQIHRYDIPINVSRLVIVAIVATGLLGLWGAIHLFKRDYH
jgi:hypothetical protein